jgi:molybdopterin synthase sulfur carrier subunit
MKIEMNLFASLARYMPDKTSSHGHRVMETVDGITIVEILKRLDVPLDKVKVIFLNGVHAKGEEILKEGDRVGVFPPVAGG